jgi:ribosomal protein S18 acetylase RimI-like enzyme
MSVPVIREGRPSDRPFLLDVLRLSALASYPPLASLGRLTLRETLETFYAEYDLLAKRIWIAEVDDQPAAGLWGIRSIHPVLEESELLVVAIATLPEHRGRGLARSLMAHAAQQSRAEGLKSVRLFANPSNAMAMELYRSLDFSPLTVELRKPLT